MIAAEEAVLTQTLALLPSPQIFGRISRCSGTAAELFKVLVLNRGSQLTFGQPHSLDVNHCIFISF